jgi:septal ring factor EnvC (AmiA/AmiB activator)
MCRRADLKTLGYTSETCGLTGCIAEQKTGSVTVKFFPEISSFFADRDIKQPGKQLHQTKQATEQQIKQLHQTKQATEQQIKQLHQTKQATEQQIKQLHQTKQATKH